MGELLITAVDLAARIAVAPDGMEIEYHRGDLARDCEKALTSLGETERKELNEVRRVAWDAGPGAPRLASLEGHGRHIQTLKTPFAKLTQRRLNPNALVSSYSYLLQARGLVGERAAAGKSVPPAPRHHVYRMPHQKRDDAR